MGDEEKQYTLTDLKHGEVAHSSRHFYGKAKAEYVNGDVFEGSFVDGVRNGDDCSYSFYSTGDVYTGRYVENMRDGHGVTEYAKNQPVDEEGNVILPDEEAAAELGDMSKRKGARYSGQWVKRLREGEGTFTYQNGDVYEGSWSLNLRHGRGKYTVKKTSCVLEGDWVGGSIQEGTLTLADGNVFRGKFENSRPSGSGTWHVFGGTTAVEGSYTQRKTANEEDEEAEGKIEMQWRLDAMMHRGD